MKTTPAMDALLDDAQAALNVLATNPSPVFRRAGAEWLERIAKALQDELAREDEP